MRLILTGVVNRMGGRDAATPFARVERISTRLILSSAIWNAVQTGLAEVTATTKIISL